MACDSNRRKLTDPSGEAGRDRLGWEQAVGPS